MAASSFGPKNEPIFADADAPDLAVNPTQAAAYAAQVGNRRVGVSADRTPLTGKDLWEGLEYYETDTGILYLYRSGWAVAGGALLTGTLTAGPTVGYSIGSTARVVKRGTQVSVNAQLLKSSALAGNDTVATLPVGFRPPATVVITGSSTNSGGSGSLGLLVAPDGTINMNYTANASAANVWMSFVFETV